MPPPIASDGVTLKDAADDFTAPWHPHAAMLSLSLTQTARSTGPGTALPCISPTEAQE
jgi:hypothetical protein